MSDYGIWLSGCIQKVCINTLDRIRYAPAIPFTRVFFDENRLFSCVHLPRFQVGMTLSLQVKMSSLVPLVSTPRPTTACDAYKAYAGTCFASYIPDLICGGVSWQHIHIRYALYRHIGSALLHQSSALQQRQEAHNPRLIVDHPMLPNTFAE
ncbi:hypothetical protein PENSPDRAFT_645850 [Peniophora sp. CONT]|nr:hypothetical protein PENSPDRAFT_645850 [Peniophora sp. CONT]